MEWTYRWSTRYIGDRLSLVWGETDNDQTGIFVIDEARYVMKLTIIKRVYWWWPKQDMGWHSWWPNRHIAEVKGGTDDDLSGILIMDGSMYGLKLTSIHPVYLWWTKRGIRWNWRVYTQCTCDGRIDVWSKTNDDISDVFVMDGEDYWVKLSMTKLVYWW